MTGRIKRASSATILTRAQREDTPALVCENPRLERAQNALPNVAVGRLTNAFLFLPGLLNQINIYLILEM
jgi:hypothetical protein